MSQRILIDLHGTYLRPSPHHPIILICPHKTEASIKHQNGDESFTFSHKTTPPPRQARRPMQSQFESKEWTGPSIDAENSAERGEPQSERHVRIQEPMRVRDHPWLAEMGLSRSRTSRVEPVSYNSWSTATHDTRDEEIRAAMDPMMLTIR
jgi:hypothetical protein